jgi:hypothetical protein
LRKEVEVGNKGGLKDNRNVRSVEKFDRIRALLTTIFLVFDGKIDSEALEINDHDENENCGQEVGKVRKISAIKSLSKSTDFIGTGNEKMEQSNNRSFEFSSATSVDCSWRKCFPNDILADVGRNEKRNSRA